LASVHRLGSYVLKLTHREESSDCVAVTIGGHWASDIPDSANAQRSDGLVLAALATDGLCRIACYTLSEVRVNSTDWRYAVSILPCTVKLQIGDEQGAEETLCSEPRRRSVQNRAGGRGAAGDLRERTKRAGAASRLRVQCLSERPSISRWQRALTRAQGPRDRAPQASWHWKCTCELPPLFGVLDQWGETAGPSRCGPLWTEDGIQQPLRSQVARIRRLIPRLIPTP
jgi:hypothetical protein